MKTIPKLSWSEYDRLNIEEDDFDTHLFEFDRATIQNIRTEGRTCNGSNYKS